MRCWIAVTALSTWVLSFTSLLLGAAQAASSGFTDPTSGVLPSYNDAYANWKNAGLLSVGGIPNRTTVCATVNPLGGGRDDFPNIQNAINGCPAGEVVQLGAGTFTVHIADLPIQISKGIILRYRQLQRLQLAVLPDLDHRFRWRSRLYGWDVRHEYFQ
jgi:hypothetical protein